jgi:Mn2+/Fe2+ NRAMP family transporter
VNDGQRSASAESADSETPAAPGNQNSGMWRSLGVGVITGAADDDPSAIGTYASAGAKFGLGFLWIAPVLLPMMYVVVYVSAKLGRVYGKGLFAAIRDRYPPWLLYTIMVGAVAGNLIEAAANLGGIGAALNLFVPLPIPLIVVVCAALVLAFQFVGSYAMLRSVFKWLALALFSYIAAAILARPNIVDVVKHTVIPHIVLSTDFLMMVVACIGTSLSAYIYTWESNQEVEEQIAEGRRKASERRGASEGELNRTKWDVLIGMAFSNLILYFIILCAGATLHASGTTDIDTAARAAAALEPLSGSGAKVLFALGVVGVGFLAVPVMTTGAAYDVVQSFGHPGSLDARPKEALLFYAVIAIATAIAVLLNFLGFNPMKALVWSGVVQGFSVPPLLCIMMMMTNDRGMMGDRANGRVTNVLGWTTTALTFAATLCLVGTWLF